MAFDLLKAKPKQVSSIEGVVSRIGSVGWREKSDVSNHHFALLLQGDDRIYTFFGPKHDGWLNDPEAIKIMEQWALTQPGDSIELLYRGGDSNRNIVEFNNKTLAATIKPS